MPNFDNMSIEEIETFRLERNLKIDALRAEIHESNEAHERKVILRNLGAQLRMDVDHLSVDDAKHMARIIAQTPRKGDVVINIEPAELKVAGL